MKKHFLKLCPQTGRERIEGDRTGSDVQKLQPRNFGISTDNVSARLFFFTYSCATKATDYERVCKLRILGFSFNYAFARILIPTSIVNLDERWRPLCMAF